MTAGTEALSPPHPKIVEFLNLWHENGRPQFERSAAPTLRYDTYKRKHAKDRRRYIALDCADTGVFLVEKSTNYVYKIDGYGKRGKFLNTLDKLIEQYTIANERQNSAEARLRRESPRRPSNPALVDENKQHELLQALFACVLHLHSFWDSLRMFEKELGCDFDNLETIVRDEWTLSPPRTLPELRETLNRILTDTAAIRGASSPARSSTEARV
jgi:hypothetical protein